mmetsp:Transcript_22063/g.27115  ORF Transcript_22063/g.27115 Transcript_22063/m.27115 type:complete len:128 (-) Transcript_22063:628-1011(-)
MVSIQFFLRKEGSAELFAMPQVGPSMPPELITCKRRKLERDHYYVDSVVVYESKYGVDAFKFNVGDLHETFGEPSEDSVAKEVRFDQDSQLVSLVGYASFSGIKAIKLAKLDKNCIVKEAERTRQEK